MTVSAGAKGWETDFGLALTKAEKNSRYILINFSGSDWCVYCKKLDREVFDSKDFQKYARSNLICVLLDFPFYKKQKEKVREQNRALAGKFDVKGYPTVVILSPNGKLVQKTGYLPGGAKRYIDHLKEIILAHEGRSL